MLNMRPQHVIDYSTLLQHAMNMWLQHVMNTIHENTR